MNENLSTEFIESVLSSLYDSLGIKVSTSPTERANFDFLIQNDKQEKTAIEVKSNANSASGIMKFIDLAARYPQIKKFILITPDEPHQILFTFFNKYVKTKSISSDLEWISIKEYLYKYFEIDFNDQKQLEKIQVAAVTTKINNYSANHIGSNISNVNFKDIVNKVESDDFKVDKNLLILRRQFPDSTLSKLNTDPEKLKAELKIGEKYNDAIIVLTDIKNFSNIVTAAEPEDLNEAMGKYYTNARDLVFKYNGILDKFIGDAVLAIFNYPKKDVDSYLNTIKFCTELSLLGAEIFSSLLSKMDQSVETGTRIGVSNGPIYTLNIGNGEMEVTFIGDKINFAARLEKNCNLNGILLSNRFYNRLCEEFSQLTEDLNIEKRELTPDDAKGQTMNTVVWQINENDLDKILQFTLTN